LAGSDTIRAITRRDDQRAAARRTGERWRRPPAARRRQAAVRRRRAAVGAAAAVAFITGLVVGRAGQGARDDSTPAGAPASATPGAAERAAVDALPLTRQVGRLVVLRFAGNSAPGYVRDAMHTGRAAGAILFRDNLTGAAQAKTLTAQLRRGAATSPLICVDQEGGDVRILPWAGPLRSAPQQAVAGTVRADAELAARALRATGVNVALAPVADVPSVPGAALAGRGFSSDFAAAGHAVAESVQGWRAGGVAPTVKHFPGLGGATVNTDDGPATIDRSAAQLRAQDLAPFRAAVQAGVPLVMVGHATYPALDPRRIASQSETIVGGLLRRELGFRGVVMTDSTEAAAVQAVTDVREAAVRNVRAGVDLVLTTGRGSYSDVYHALLGEARRDPAFRARVRESAARVLALQRSLGG
jgi:beta-N-acetylhexosaminidase